MAEPRLWLAPHCEQIRDVWSRFESACAEPVVQAADLLVRSLERGARVFVAGNGGSAAQAQHLAAELVGRYRLARRRPLPAVALTTDTSILTAVTNDFSYEEVFARQIDALAQPGDLLVALSTSGVSPNIVRAARRARAREVPVIALTGDRPSDLGRLADVTIAAPSSVTPRIQEVHLACLHLLCEAVDAAFGEEGPPS